MGGPGDLNSEQASQQAPLPTEPSGQPHLGSEVESRASLCESNGLASLHSFDCLASPSPHSMVRQSSDECGEL